MPSQGDMYQPPIPLHTLAPLTPVHYDILQHLLELAPTKYMRLSKAHRAHAVRHFSRPILLDQALEDRFYKTTISDGPQNISFLLPVFYADTIRVDDLQAWASLAIDFGRVYKQRKRSQGRGKFACKYHPDTLFRHVRQIGISFLPFATIPSLTRKAAREKIYQLRNLFDQSVDHEIGKEFEELAIFVDQPFVADADSKQYAFDHFLPTGHWARQKTTTIYIPFGSINGPSVEDLQERLPIILAQNLEYHSSRIVIYPSSSSSSSSDPDYASCCPPLDVVTIIARYLAGRARLRAARREAGNKTVFDLRYAEFNVPHAKEVRGMVMPMLKDEVNGRYEEYRAEMEREVRIVELEPALVPTVDYRSL
ncbi:hypothetical protein IAR50_005311 [Cryptococcus sp. DSM 104548]